MHHAPPSPPGLAYPPLEVERGALGRVWVPHPFPNLHEEDKALKLLEKPVVTPPFNQAVALDVRRNPQRKVGKGSLGSRVRQQA